MNAAAKIRKMLVTKTFLMRREQNFHHCYIDKGKKGTIGGRTCHSIKVGHYELPDSPFTSLKLSLKIKDFLFSR